MNDTNEKELYIGIMSGTSLDGIDVALVEFEQEKCKLIASKEAKFPTELQTRLNTLANAEDDSLDSLALADRQIAAVYANQVNTLLSEHDIAAETITAIGCHGQTVRHQPNTDNQGYTLQIGDPNTLAELTGIDVVADFRRRDIAAGGEGAPLAPAFHNHVFACQNTTRAVVNIGGIGNITLLEHGKPVRGYDTGPGNRLMDYWIEKQQNKSYDKDGQWASSGNINPELLACLLDDPYFDLPAPKSTGREYFNSTWLENKLSGFSQLPAEDIQATLAELTSVTIINDIKTSSPACKEIYICGGGAYNSYLMSRLAVLAGGIPVKPSSELGVEPCWVEAMAFAWLAKRFLQGLPGNQPGVTGANGERILGGFYKA